MIYNEVSDKLSTQNTRDIAVVHTLGQSHALRLRRYNV